MSELSRELKLDPALAAQDGSANGQPPALRPDVAATSDEYENRQTYLQGARLHLTTAALSLCLFLTNLEIPIVVTALVDITNQLGGFSESNWVVSAYLLGYAGILIIVAKLSDIFGRKPVLLVMVLVFVVFSGACGASQSIRQLIIFRSFQGIGGAGNYAVSMVVILELVPSHKYAMYTSAISIVYSLSLLLGPILGGAIAERSAWRWIFLLNVPAGLVVVVVIFFSIPNGFPHHAKPPHERPNLGRVFSSDSIKRLDHLGTALLLLATVFLVSALEEAGKHYPWKSAFIITFLIISGLSWIAFFIWERRVTLQGNVREPVFPWRFVQSRVWIGMLLNALFLGAPWFCAAFQLPQRLQIVNSLSPLDAGVRFIPFTLAAPLGTAFAPIVAKMAKIPPIYLVLLAAILQVVGLALISTLPNTREVIPAQYGYEIIAGFGCGINITLLLLMAPFSVQERDKAVAMGSVAQFRVMGGAIGLAIITAAFNGLVMQRLSNFLSNDQLSELLLYPGTITSYPSPIQDAIRNTFADGYTLQIKILAGLAAGQIPATLLMWQKNQIMV
ncbi:hypothetical protein NUW58_g9397 [Xylaria curta]|uniref:Uncharacterized protein n=1 Tax=Xylaria curta TaxID=42375 RepID=A0ACC1MZ55_9PEZI|nr:hypothetical protein NUW58_g9397 [Xylaria curta]